MVSIAVPLRSPQGFRRTKAMPVFSPLPMKLKPDTAMTPSTAGFLRITSPMSPIAFFVRSMLAPDGSCTMANAKPWSSSGTKLDGRRANRKPHSTATTANSSIQRGMWRIAEKMCPV